MTVIGNTIVPITRKFLIKKEYKPTRNVRCRVVAVGTKRNTAVVSLALSVFFVTWIRSQLGVEN